MKSIFVSSTFRDMQAERDILHLNVLPILRQKAKQYGQSINFIDLRWGVNTANMSEDDANNKVIKVCLDNIDKSAPYMLIFLGDRYGWMPPQTTLTEVTKEMGYTIKNYQKSVTALEIEYGVLSKSDLSNCILCIRENLPYANMGEYKDDYMSEGQVQKEKLDTLRAELIERMDGRVIYYSPSWNEDKHMLSGLEYLQEELVKEFLLLFEKEWEDKFKVNPLEKEMLASDLFFEENLQLFSGRQELVNEYLNELEYGPNYFLLKGRPGTGKSSILAKLAYELENEEFNVFRFACGNSSKSNKIEDFLSQAIWYLKNSLNELDDNIIFEKDGLVVSADDENTMSLDIYQETGFRIEKNSGAYLVNQFQELCDKYNDYIDCALFFIIDGMDQLIETETLRNLSFLSNHDEDNICFALSMQEDYEMPNTYELSDITPHILPDLQGEKDIRLMLKGILDSVYKDLDECVWQKLLQKKMICNPLYSSILLWRLICMDANDLRNAKDGNEINTQIITIIEKAPNNVKELSKTILLELGKRVQQNFLQMIVSLIAVSRNGLSEPDLQEICMSNKVDWDPLSFAIIQKYLSRYFIEREDGRIDFSHHVFKEAFLDDMKEPTKYHRYICQHLKKDAFSKAEGFYHASQANDKELLFDIMSEIDDWLLDASKHVRADLQIYYDFIDLNNKGKTDWIIELVKEYSYKNNFENIIRFLVNVFYGEYIEMDCDMYSLGLKILKSFIPFVKKADWNSATKVLTKSDFFMVLGQCSYNISKDKLEWKQYFEEAIGYIERVIEGACIHEADTIEEFNPKQYIIICSNYAALCIHDNDYFTAQKYMDRCEQIIDRYVDSSTYNYRNEIASVHLHCSKIELHNGNDKIAMLRCEIAKSLFIDDYNFTMKTIDAIAIIECCNVLENLYKQTNDMRKLLFNIEDKITYAKMMYERSPDMTRLTSFIKSFEEAMQLYYEMLLPMKTYQTYVYLKELLEVAFINTKKDYWLYKHVLVTCSMVRVLLVSGYYDEGRSLLEELAEFVKKDGDEEKLALVIELVDDFNQEITEFKKYKETRKEQEMIFRVRAGMELTNINYKNGVTNMEIFSKMLERGHWNHNYALDVDKNPYINVVLEREGEMDIFVTFTVNYNFQTFLATSPLSFNIEEKDIEKMLYAITTINNKVSMGHFEYDFKTRYISFRNNTNFVTSDSESSYNSLQNFLEYTLYTVDSYNKLLLGVCNNKITNQELYDVCNNSQ